MRKRPSAPAAKTQNAPSESAAPNTRRRSRLVAAGLLVALLLAGGGVFADWWYGLPDDAQATYVGRQTCAECHQGQLNQWTGSHHDLAMDRATPETVLGDFSGQTLTHYGVTSTMFQREGKYFVNTEGPDGKMADFEVKYVFGVDPLQQYMVEFDRTDDMPENEIARLQVLRISWDTKKKQWFHLDPPDVSDRLQPGDDLHWTGIGQRWNTMCADCHSTNLQKNYDAFLGQYRTTFSEIDVSCEACHGPGSLHVELARQPSLFWDRKRGPAIAGFQAMPNVAEIQACAPCHSRRRIVHGDFTAGSNYYDYYANELLSRNVYHADGQIEDEDYEYGSFLQSKMFHKGIRCSDCHNPHSAKLKFEGNKVCTSCHQHPAGKYDSPSHHRHAVGSSGAQCVNCHMPETTYMAVDPRRDHSLRVPRPDLSVELGTPNACTGCHIKEARPPEAASRLKEHDYAYWLKQRDEDERARDELRRVDRWADEQVNRWYGHDRRPAHFASALHAAREQTADAPQKLADLLADNKMPAIARATAALELGIYIEPNGKLIESLRDALADRDPQVRAAAVISLQAASQEEILGSLPKLLHDETRLVRTEAARILAPFGEQSLNSGDKAAFRQSLAEFKEGLESNNDRAVGHLLLGVLYEQTGELKQAQLAYETAIRVEPGSMGARTNLAALFDRMIDQAQQRAQQAAQLGDKQGIEDALAPVASLHYEADKLRGEELALLERDSRLAPDNAAIQHRLGLSQYLLGWRKEAEHSLLKAALLEPRNPEYVFHLTVLYRDLGRLKESLAWARKLVALRPQNAQFEQLLAEIESASRADASTGERPERRRLPGATDN